MNRRSTRQRDIIARIFEQAEGPLTVPETHQEAQKILPQIGIATVYRTLKLLQEQDRIHQLILDGETLYERNEIGKNHYFRCNGCHKVYSIQASFIQLPASQTFGSGFMIEHHEVILYGKCPSCAQMVVNY